MTLRRIFRAISLVVVMAVLLLLYRIHPIAGWATLAVLGLVTFVAHRRKVTAALAE